MEITGKKQKLRKNAFVLFFLLPTLVCFCVFYLYPIATVVISSFAKWDYTNLNDMQMYSFGHLFDNYKYIFEKYPYFWEGLRNSCIWALCGLVVQVPIATGVALVISKKCRGWKLARNIYVIPNIISSAAMGLIFLQLYNPSFCAEFPGQRTVYTKGKYDRFDLRIHLLCRNKHDHGSGTDFCNTGRGS